MQRERISTSIAKKIITIFISLIILIIQILLFYVFFFSVGKYQIFYYFMELVGLFCVIRLYSRNMNSSYKLTWSIIILIFSFAGTFLYLMFGNGRSIPKRKNIKIQQFLKERIPNNDVMDEQKNIHPTAYRLAKIINTTTHFPLYKNTDLTFFNDAALKHRDMIYEIKKATKFIFMEYFIVSDGYLLEELISALEEKSKEGIEIKFCYDSIGSSRALKRSTLNRIKKIKNLEITAYEPLGININPAINYRDHRKMTIIDGNIAYIGGDNLADEYIHKIEKFGYWRDNALKLKGEAVYSYTVLFAEIWYMSTKKIIDITSYKGTYMANNKDTLVMPFGDGPTNDLNPTYGLFKSLIGTAKQTLYISTPYLVIDKDFLNTICLAARSGVDVKILVPHIPDKKSVFMMSRAHYGEILEAGGKIYEYSLGFNHAKNVICDDKYAYIGTTNVDYRSMFLHFEAGALVLHDDCINEMSKDFLNAIAQSEEISLENWKKRSRITKIMSGILNILSPLI